MENWTCSKCKALNPPRRNKCWQCGILRPHRIATSVERTQPIPTIKKIEPPKKKQRSRSLNPAVIVAVIGLIGTLITAIAASPVLIALIQKPPIQTTQTADARLTQLATETAYQTLSIPTETVVSTIPVSAPTHSPSPTAIPSSTPVPPTEVVLVMTIVPPTFAPPTAVLPAEVPPTSVLPTTSYQPIFFSEGFEQGFADWKSIGSVTLAIGRNDQTGIAISDLDDFSEIYQIFSNLVFLEGKKYQVTVWCKTSNGNYCTLIFGDIDTDYNLPNGENIQYDTLEGNNEWQELSVCMQLTRNEIISVYLDGKTDDSRSSIKSNDNKIYDEVSVNEVEHCS